jgi:hypothetical protein
MNIGDYVTSGVLQDYCFGLLTNEEELKVEAMCNSYPEVAKELQLLRQGLEKFAGSKETWRSDILRNAVWESVKKLWET